MGTRKSVDEHSNLESKGEERARDRHRYEQVRMFSGCLDAVAIGVSWMRCPNRALAWREHSIDAIADNLAVIRAGIGDVDSIQFASVEVVCQTSQHNPHHQPVLWLHVLTKDWSRGVDCSGSRRC